VSKLLDGKNERRYQIDSVSAEERREEHRDSYQKENARRGEGELWRKERKHFASMRSFFVGLIGNIHEKRSSATLEEVEEDNRQSWLLVH